MTTYRVKNEEVEAIEFTKAFGAEVAAAFSEDVPVAKRSHPSGITFEAGRGYRFHGSAIAFGDFVVTSHGAQCVMSEKDFKAKYEAVVEPVVRERTTKKGKAEA